MASRRTFLAAGAAGVIGLLSGCGASAPDPEPGAATDTEHPDSSPVGSPTDPASPSSEEPGPVGLRTIASGLGAPVAFVEDPVGGRYYVAEQAGRIRVIEDGTLRDAPVLDVSDRIATGGERGLLGLALHPSFGENRRLFVRYSDPAAPSGHSHTFVLSEFEADGDGRGVRPDSERVLLEIPEPQSNHNSGSVVFGPDGYLYVGVGDGGGGGDTGAGHVDDWYDGVDGGNGQDVASNLLGSVLRIDVDSRGSDTAYGIPEDNPLVGREGLDEHYAWGFRNPWGMSFDGDRLLVADVGQNRYEEVDAVTRGGNYGWNVREGAHCFRAETCPAEDPDGRPLRDPVIEYPHGGEGVTGNAVIGGYVYRGEAIPGLDGEYVFGDLAAGGQLFRATAGPEDSVWLAGVLELRPSDRGAMNRLIAMGRDRDGELYALAVGDGGGGVHRLVAEA